MSIRLWRAADVSTHVITVLGLLLLHEAGARHLSPFVGVPSHRSHPEDGGREHACHPNSDIVYACTCGASACVVGGVCEHVYVHPSYFQHLSVLCLCFPGSACGFLPGSGKPRWR